VWWYSELKKTRVAVTCTVQVLLKKRKKRKEKKERKEFLNIVPNFPSSSRLFLEGSLDGRIHHGL
jgi:hypothetical protein